ncbi:hypothetical protein SAMN02990966_06099 [Rhodospirillales bacterium URHD0017]|nr:hypothetical protein SAMN02990966_06099 [Rhodospirillales bacterium URHD0017]
MGEPVAVDRHHNGPPDCERIELAALPVPKRRGRPSLYTPETVDRICDRLADGESLKAIWRSSGMPSERAVLGWAATRPDFRDQYDFARDMGRETIGHDVLAIADGPLTGPDAVKDARRRIDALKWRFAQMTPKRRGRNRQESQL